MIEVYKEIYLRLTTEADLEVGPISTAAKDHETAHLLSEMDLATGSR